jgi:hypothetical protein
MNSFALLGLVALASAVLSALVLGFAVRLWVHHRRMVFQYTTLRRWDRALTYVRWGAYMFLWVSLLAIFAEWPYEVVIWSFFAFTVTLIYALRARAIVRVWLEQLEAGRPHLT